jgi:hypothetical protein
MLLNELLYKDTDEDLYEAAKLVWARKGKEAVKKYRCTSGRKQGRLVNNPSDCGGPLDMKKRQRMRMTRKKKEKPQARKTKRTKRTNPASKRVQQLNKRLT